MQGRREPDRAPSHLLSGPILKQKNQQEERALFLKRKEGEKKKQARLAPPQQPGPHCTNPALPSL